MHFKNLTSVLKCKKDDANPMIFDWKRFAEKYPDYAKLIWGRAGPFSAIICPVCKQGTYTNGGISQRSTTAIALMNWNELQG